ncbi:hypothetical protein B0H34DRAFT_622978, partial [Crassisporium funariophilum]
KTPGPERGPKPSMISHKAIKTVCKNAAKPQKRLLADTLMEIHCENLAAQKEQTQSRINLELCKQITDELKCGLWTVKQAQEKIAALKNNNNPRPAKRQRLSREPSPDWDEISSGS